MDAHDHHQKDFLSLFPPDQQQSNDSTLPIFYNPSRAQQQTMPMPNSPTIDILGTMMQMQGLESQAAPSATSPAFQSQSLLEQQFKLSQLQQLQQLQNQIFQQQASPPPFLRNICIDDVLLIDCTYQQSDSWYDAVFTLKHNGSRTRAVFTESVFRSPHPEYV